MSEAESQPVPAIPAATIILLRDGETGPEVLVMERHKTMGFAAGAVVFPGGKLDVSDSDPALLEHLTGDSEQSLPLLEYRLGGIRELFEEAGVLLARAAGRESDTGFDLARRQGLAASYRDALLAAEIGLVDMARGEGLSFQPSDLHHFSHWVTPEPVPKRFDTQFFVATAPPDQWDLVEGNEAVAMYWKRPDAILADERDGNIGLMFPTRLNLQVLARHDRVEDVVTEANKTNVVTVMPRIVLEGEAVFLEIPEEAGYGVTRVPRDEVFEARFAGPQSSE